MWKLGWPSPGDRGNIAPLRGGAVGRLAKILLLLGVAAVAHAAPPAQPKPGRLARVPPRPERAPAAPASVARAAPRAQQPPPRAAGESSQVDPRHLLEGARYFHGHRAMASPTSTYSLRAPRRTKGTLRLNAPPRPSNDTGAWV